jgi:hypothetical protein
MGHVKFMNFISSSKDPDHHHHHHHHDPSACYSGDYNSTCSHHDQPSLALFLMLGMTGCKDYHLGASLPLTNLGQPAIDR